VKIKRRMESDTHYELKKRAVKILKEKYGFKDSEIRTEYPVLYKGHHLIVDVVGVRKGFKVAIECGRVKQERIEKLRMLFDEVLHIGYSPAKFPKSVTMRVPKSRFIGVRLTAEEDKALKRLMEKLGYTCKSDFIRALIRFYYIVMFSGLTVEKGYKPHILKIAKENFEVFEKYPVADLLKSVPELEKELE